jgi:hypothetical protein
MQTRHHLTARLIWISFSKHRELNFTFLNVGVYICLSCKVIRLKVDT